MKKFCSMILTAIMIVAMMSAASAAGYTLPEKMERQLQVGSGLKGSFVIHANADPERYPLLHSIQNAEFEIRGIQYEGNQHYYIYQSGENETLNALTEYSKIDGAEYLRSDFLDYSAILLPTADHLINAWLKSEGENPSVFPDLLRMVLNSKEEPSLNTENLERQIELMISAFSTKPFVQREEGSPRMNQTFRIPVEMLYETVADLLETINSSESYMGFFREFLDQEQIDTYMNPNLGYYYVDAMKQLDMKGDILLSRTVSTLGDLIESSLVLPLDTGKTGYDSLTIANSETRKSLLLEGPRGVIYLDLPLEFELKAEQYENAEIRFVRIDHERGKSPNVALKIIASKNTVKFDSTEDNRIHENESYTLKLTRDTEKLPDGVSEEMIPETEDAEAEIGILWSSKSQLSSPTTLELSCKVNHGKFSLGLQGSIKTASPWVFTPFDTRNAVDAGLYEMDDLEKLKETWIENAEKMIVRIPGEPSSSDDETEENESSETESVPLSAGMDTSEEDHEETDSDKAAVPVSNSETADDHE